MWSIRSVKAIETEVYPSPVHLHAALDLLFPFILIVVAFNLVEGCISVVQILEDPLG